MEGRKEGRYNEGLSYTIACVQGCTVVCLHELAHNTYCCLIQLRHHPAYSTRVTREEGGQ